MSAPRDLTDEELRELEEHMEQLEDERLDRANFKLGGSREWDHPIKVGR